ncbi:hypothetical protein [Enterococcus faecalis]|uniref:hypothetical protein n=1 Tax=Enterococcus faecalis TaxID=1351 RepID=UPI002FDC00B6
MAEVERGDRNITIQTLEKITGGLDEVPSSIFKFDSLNFDKKYFERKVSNDLTKSNGR